VQKRRPRAATMIFMTSPKVSAVARQAHSALAGIRSIPSRTDADDAEALRLIAEADQLTENFRGQHKTPAAEKAWLAGLRSLVAQGNEIQRKYRW
jgi:hypothetical protein